LLCVPVADSRKDGISSIDQIAPTQLADVTEFFRTYRSLEGRTITILGWLDHGAVPELLASCREAAAAGH
jgi:inorganic pyrophosphatase